MSDFNKRIVRASERNQIPFARWFGSVALLMAVPLATPAAELEEVVVTAQKREESLQDVPLSVSAVSSETLGAYRQSDLMSLTGSLPNIEVSRVKGTTSTFIRGIGNSLIIPGSDPSVAVQADDVVIARGRAQVGAQFDLDRIEVLRGPQGTLYGRNATGGLINIYTKQPTQQLEASGRLTYGNYDTKELEAAVSGPLAETLQGRLAFYGVDRGGFGTNRVTGTDIDDLHEYGGRGKLRWQPADSVTVDLTAGFYRADDHAFVTHNLGALRPGQPGVYGAQLSGLPSAPNFRDINANEDPSRKLDIESASAKLAWQIADRWTFKSITGYIHSDSNFRQDQDGTAVDILRIREREDAKQWSQEFQVQGDFDALKFVVGAFYFTEDIKGGVLVPFPNFPGDLLTVAPGVSIPSGADLNNDGIVNSLAHGLPGDRFEQQGKLKTDAWAVFTQGTYDVTDRLHLTAGVRYSDEKKSNEGFFALQVFGGLPLCGGPCPNLLVPLPPTDVSWTSVTPRFAAAFDLNDDVLLFASASKGFKSGAFDGPGRSTVVDPETVWSYELGTKSRLLVDTLQINGTLFYSKFSDMQLAKIINAASDLENAGAATIYGLELEIAYAIADATRLDVFYGYQDATFDRYISEDPVFTLARYPTAGDNQAGNRLPYTSKHSLGVGLRQDWTLQQGMLRLYGNAQYKSDYYLDAYQQDHSFRHQDAYWTLASRLTYTFPDDKISVSVWGNNLTNEEVITNAFASAEQDGVGIIGAINQPRTYGVDLAVHF